MKPFNLDQALAGKPVVNGEGVAVTDFHVFENVKSVYKLVAVRDRKLTTYTMSGCHEDNKVTASIDLYMKEETININGFEVPKPETEELDFRQEYCFPAFTDDASCEWNEWCGDGVDYSLLANGMIHLAEENAMKHAEALRSFTKGLK